MTATQVHTAIIGGGLSGLAAADRLARAGTSFVLFEARARLGGRARSVTFGPTADAFDVGPAWFWPGQPRMDALVRRLGLSVFEQHARGNLVFEDEAGRVRRDLEFSTMAGALRVDGGFARVIEGLAATLPPGCVRTGVGVRTLRDHAEGIDVLDEAGRVLVRAGRVLVCVPPRLAAESIAYDPPLTAEQRGALAAVPTWMAGHAKFIAVYREPSWRAAGLNGDAISRRGPMAEIHDASPQQAGTGALFGFLGLGAPLRAQLADLESRCVAQLTHLFGTAAADPIATHLVDWATERWTATPRDGAEPPTAHPTYGLPAVLLGTWDGRLRWCSTEAVEEHGGLLEGALAAAAQGVSD